MDGILFKRVFTINFNSGMVPTSRTIRNTLRSLNTIMDCPLNGRRQAPTIIKSKVEFHCLRKIQFKKNNKIKYRSLFYEI